MKKTDLICEDFGLDNGLVKKTKYETVDLSKIVLDSENAKKLKRDEDAVEHFGETEQKTIIKAVEKNNVDFLTPRERQLIYTAYNNLSLFMKNYIFYILDQPIPYAIQPASFIYISRLCLICIFCIFIADFPA